MKYLPKNAFDFPFYDAISRIYIFFFAIILYFIFSRDKWKGDRNNLAIATLSIFYSTFLFFLFLPTPYGLNGIFGDSLFRTAYITKFSYHWDLIDFFYKDLPSFYSPLYFYILGKLTTIFNKEPYEMVKIGFILTAFFLPFVSFYFWSKIIPKKLAVLVTYFSFFGLNVILFLHKADEFIALLLFVPWWLYYVGNIRNNGKDIWWYIWGGLIGAVIFQFAFLWFFIGCVSLILRLVLRYKLNKMWNIFVMLALTALFSSYFWGRLLLSITKNGIDSFQNRAFQPYMVQFPFPFFEISVIGVLLFIGLIGLIYFFKKSELFSSIGLLLFSCYLWYILGYFGIILNSPILHSKMTYMIDYLLIISFILTLNGIYDFLKRNLTINPHFVIILLLVLMIFFGEVSLIPIKHTKQYKDSLTQELPVELLETIKLIDYKDKVFLTSYQPIFAYLPVYGFISPVAHYSHPAGQFSERVEFLEKLSNINDSYELLINFRNNKFDRIDYLLLREENNIFILYIIEDDFPVKMRKRKDIQFDNSLFDDRCFEHIKINDYHIIRPKYEILGQQILTNSRNQ